MSERSVLLLLQDIETSVSNIILYTTGLSLTDYRSDRKTRDAVERNFEIIGEAAGKIPDSFKKLNSGIEWRIIKDFRNLLIHHYFGIEHSVIWDIIQNRLPDLLQKVRFLIEENQ